MSLFDIILDEFRKKPSTERERDVPSGRRTSGRAPVSDIQPAARAPVEVAADVGNLGSAGTESTARSIPPHLTLVAESAEDVSIIATAIPEAESRIVEQREVQVVESTTTVGVVGTGIAETQSLQARALLTAEPIVSSTSIAAIGGHYPIVRADSITEREGVTYWYNPSDPYDRRAYIYNTVGYDSDGVRLLKKADIFQQSPAESEALRLEAMGDK